MEDTATKHGLTTDQAREAREKFGANSISAKEIPAWRRYARSLTTPIPLLLLTATILEWILGKRVESFAMLGLLLFNATLEFVQDLRARHALAELRKKLSPHALVLRDNEWTTLDAGDVVHGDRVVLSLGASVPADATVLLGAIAVDEAALTGESDLLEKGIGDKVLSGSIVRRGRAEAIVTAVGEATFFGRTAKLASTAQHVSNEQSAVMGITRNIALFNGAVTVIALVIGAHFGMSVPALAVLALVALLMSIPAALPAMFTLSASASVNALAPSGVLPTRLSSVNEAASVDVLCSDKTGTLTTGTFAVKEVVACKGYTEDVILRLAALASPEGSGDPVDAAIRNAGGPLIATAPARVAKFVPFDPSTKTSEAFIEEPDGTTLHVIKGAWEKLAETATNASELEAHKIALAESGRRVIAVATDGDTPRIIGLIAISDPPRPDSAPLVARLRELGVRTLMVTGDGPATAERIAQEVGITGAVCHSERIIDECLGDEFSVFARVLPENKFALVKALQGAGHTVAVCGDGVNDAPALAQANTGFAVLAATDAAKAAASVVLTESGLSGIVATIEEGRIGFQRIVAYTLNMMTKKLELVIFLVFNLALTKDILLTPALTAIMFITGDFLTMSLATDRPRAAEEPRRWDIKEITKIAMALAMIKLLFSIALVVYGAKVLHLDTEHLQTLSFVTIVLGAQSVLYAVRERGRIWSSRPTRWIALATLVDVAITAIIALGGFFTARISPMLFLEVLVTCIAFAFIMDYAKSLFITKTR